MELTKNEITLTSLEIAELTGKRHPDVQRDIKVQLEELGDVSKFAHIYKDTRNRDQTMYILPKRECLILISGYSVKLRASIIDRLQFLENEIQDSSITKETIHVDITNARWRKAFYLAFDKKCFYTGQPLKEDAFHLDHIIPKSRGGQDILENLVLSSPTVNQSKNDACSVTHSARNLKTLKEVYMPAVLKYYHLLSGELVHADFPIKAFGDPKFIDKLEQLFGIEPVKKLYSSLMPGLKVDTTKRAYNEVIGDFIEECTAKDEHGFVLSDDMYQSYLSFCKASKVPASGKRVFTNVFKNTYGIPFTRAKVVIEDGKKRQRSGFTEIIIVG